MERQREDLTADALGDRTAAGLSEANAGWRGIGTG